MSDWVSIDDELPSKDGLYETKSAYYDDGALMRFFKVESSFLGTQYNVWYYDESSQTSSITHWK